MTRIEKISASMKLYFDALSDEERAKLKTIWTLKNQNPDRIAKVKLAWSEKLLNASWDSLSLDRKKKRVKLEQNNICNSCNGAHWLGFPIILEVDHIDGNRLNNNRDNLEAICPNCHSMTPTWRGRNKSKQISDEDFVAELIKCNNIKEALDNLGIAVSGKSYDRAKVLIRAAS